MDVLISVVIGVFVLLVLAVLIISSIGVGEQFLDPVIGVLGAPIIRLSRSINAARRERSIKKLPPDVPAPPPGP
jgi:hypothetical protein